MVVPVVVLTVVSGEVAVHISPVGIEKLTVLLDLVVCPAAKKVPLVILMIAVTLVMTPVDFSLSEPVDVEPSLQLVTAVPPLATTVPFGVGVARPAQVACCGGLPVGS